MPKIKTILLLLTASLILLGTTSGVSMGKDYDSESPMVNAYWMSREIIITEDNEAVNQAVAFNWKNAEYLVVWQWPDGIYGQRINRFGELVGTHNFPISTSAEARDFPDVAYDPINNRYFVVWCDERSPSTNDYDLSGRFIPWEGPDTNLNEFKIDSRPANTVKPQVVYNTAQKDFLVLWTEQTLSIYNTSGIRIKASDGSKIGSVKVITGASGTDHAEAAFNSFNGAYLVVRDKYISVPSPNYDVFGIQLKGDLNAFPAGEFGIAGWPDDEQSPAVAACKDANQYLVAWQSSGNFDIYARPVSENGIPSSVVYHLRDTPGYIEKEPDVACDTAGKHYLAVWEEQDSSTANVYGIWGRLVDTGGGMDPPFEIVASTNEFPNHRYPVIAGGDNQYMVVWDNKCKSGGCRTIHARIIYFFEEPPSKIYVFKHTQPRYTGGSFEIELSGGPDSIKRTFFLKDDDVPYNSGPLKAGAYDLDEALYDKWKFVSLT